ncbi:MAG: hypothetical protein UT55_C0007G0016 [Candidatus Peregrinibacteria bacterium GW2011_GWE2_39_6]|nr:MAG: hypothetical protein UT36_C0001G0145 [Candidatus Peregrinibacteria bacterium GW2011_GWF2_39_17]KKR26485.1 MAG: hypothetical protein UT55_C0007G0016 [Candidatus Peregrinibacteria bacterium GW2011_GWE2_39_6]HCW32583.1 hypothetical protein [Candidatus Peregrinibacteria bacterium]
MIGIQIIAITFGLVSLYFSYYQYRRRIFTIKEFLFWFILWTGFLFVSFFPQSVSPYIKNLGFSRLMDFVIVIAVVVIFCILLHNYLVVRRLEHRIEQLVRELALKNLKVEKDR